MCIYFFLYTQVLWLWMSCLLSYLKPVSALVHSASNCCRTSLQWSSPLSLASYVFSSESFHWCAYFLQFLTDGCLGCFHTSAIVNNVPVNIGVNNIFPNWYSVFLAYIPRSKIVGSYGSFRFFKKLLYSFLQCLYQFTSPPTVYHSSLFPLWFSR